MRIVFSFLRNFKRGVSRHQFPIHYINLYNNGNEVNILAFRIGHHPNNLHLHLAALWPGAFASMNPEFIAYPEGRDTAEKLALADHGQMILLNPHWQVAEAK